MEIDHDQLKRLVAKPSEGLNQELKRWLDPSKPGDQAKIVKAVLALRNRNGGHLLIGFDDKTHEPDPAVPSDMRRTFNNDRIQQLVSNYSSEPFGIELAFVEHDNHEHPVIVVPAGVRVPVAIRKPLRESGKDLLKVGEVPFRTLRANGSYSTAAAAQSDWRDLLEICFENREADIGRFLRRHIGGLISALAGTSRAEPDSNSVRERAQSLLARGFARYRQVKDRRGVAAGPEEQAIKWGKWEVAAVIDPPVQGRVADENLYGLLVGSNPQYTEWPSWPDTRAFSDDYARPNTREGGWESFVLSIGSAMPWDFLTFYRLEPDGQLYQIRALDDDALARARSGKPGSSLDPGLIVTQVTESIAVVLRFAIALGCNTEAARVGFAFRWRGLSGRNLFAWSSHIRMPPAHYVANDDEAEGFILVPVGTSEAALAPYVEEAVKSVLAKFHGYPVSRDMIESRVRLLVERRT